ncbi:DUF3885 domain-containing protein [Clostridium kluyveri]|uniref:DUF3885 domain-containing protein n=1 Tax=Clostridium kluyveri TaxID=1534 RepID=A0A1L5F4N0_CLOKL|nr:DUF3885 domain-containing protein [Clostridium kluyveri]APM37978.1 hypothetical protein BS101_04135 [Clostridium kluyveri]
MLKELMEEELKLMGLNSLEHPIFYNCQYGIRFEIGVGNVYNKDMTPRKEYVESALSRAMTIYNNGIKSPTLLMWEVYPQGEEDKSDFEILFSKKIISILPQEEFSQDIDIDNEVIKRTQLYWDLKKSNIPMNKVFREIIIGDLGGSEDFISSIYLFDVENHVMLHLYDDRGLDIVAYDKNKLIPIYQKLNTWILDYDRKQIDKIFFV